MKSHFSDFDIRKLTAAAMQLKNAARDISSALKNLKGALAVLVNFEQNVQPLQEIEKRLSFIHDKLDRASDSIQAGLPKRETREAKYTIDRPALELKDPSKTQRMIWILIASAGIGVLVLYLLFRFAVQSYISSGQF